LICYFLDDQNTAAKLKIDLSKGILLGPVGCGETTLMKLDAVRTASQQKSFKTRRDISFEFIKDGYEVIHRYSHGHNTHAEHKNYCFDDLGTENNPSNISNESNVIAEIIL
jgi:ATPase subunit of ABC transporter with duplicated ATPase domains